MSGSRFVGGSSVPASHILGHKLDSIPFSTYHVMIILVLGAVGFVEGYDLRLADRFWCLRRCRWD